MYTSLPSSLLFTHSVLTSMSAKTTEMSLQQQTTALAKEVSLKLSAPASFTIDELEAISTFFSQQIEALRESSAAAIAAAALLATSSRRRATHPPEECESTGETKEAPSNAGKGDLASQAAALLQQRKDRLKQIDTLNEPIRKLTADIKRTEIDIENTTTEKAAAATATDYDKAGKCKAKLVEYEAKLAKQSAELLEKSAEVAAKFLEKRCEKQKGSELLEAQSLLALIEQALVETKVEEIELVKQEEFALAGEKKKEVANLVKMSFALDCIVSFIVIVMFLNSFCFRDYFFSLFF